MAESLAPALVIERARAGEEAAFAELYEEYGPAIFRYTARLLGDAAAAADVTQDTFTRAFTSLHELRDPTRIEPWLYRIASRRCLDILRRRRLLAVLRLGHPETPEPASEGDEARFAEADLVRRVLRRLSPTLAVCLTLRVVEGFSVEEIAETLGLSKEAVWTRLSRARAEFARHYEVLSAEC